MSSFLTILSTAVLFCTFCSADVQGRKKQVKPSPAVAAQTQTAASQPQLPQPQAPQPAVTPEHGPSSPPDVNFQGGQLTIVARNSTMSDVLNAVRQKTGAAVDMPPVAGERVVGQFGPGAPRDVIAQLLNGSHFDYVLLGSPAEPTALKKIVLMARSSNAPPTQGPINPPPNQNLQQVPDVENQSPEEMNNGEATPNGQPTEEEVQPEQPDQTEQPEQSDQQQQPPTIKTPEQLLRELQQQQQQQQQEQQPDPSAPPGAPGQPPEQ